MLSTYPMCHMTFSQHCPIIGGMSPTPLYTKEQLDAKIEQTKKNLDAAEQVQAYTHHGRQVQRARIGELEDRLDKLQRHRMRLEGVSSLQAIVGRAYRG